MRLDNYWTGIGDVSPSAKRKVRRNGNVRLALEVREQAKTKIRSKIMVAGRDLWRDEIGQRVESSH